MLANDIVEVSTSWENSEVSTSSSPFLAVVEGVRCAAEFLASLKWASMYGMGSYNPIGQHNFRTRRGTITCEMWYEASAPTQCATDKFEKK